MLYSIAMTYMFDSAEISEGHGRVMPNGAYRTAVRLAKAGPLVYSSRELDIEGPDRPVTVHRTLDSLSHPDTMDTVRGTTVVTGHPDRFVNPENFKSHVVGNLIGEPWVDGDSLYSEIEVSDKEAIDRVRNAREVSIGYDGQIDTRTMQTEGPLIVNHLALVDRARGGSDVRLLDEQTPREDTAMDAELKNEIMEMIQSAVTGSKADEGTDVRSLTDGIMAGVEKIIDSKFNDAAAKDAAKKAADELVAATRAEERQRWEVLQMLSPDKRQEFMNSDTRQILVAATRDFVPDAEHRDDNYLSGALAGMQMAQQNAVPAQPMMDGQMNGQLPETMPFQRFADAVGGPVRSQPGPLNPNSAREAAYSAYVNRLHNSHKNKSGGDA